ncbi:MAG: response regulator transcription factor [Bernardetiaceae bacterium]|jgi:DNA-binding response OmpR family regulator|nr:response regulator transcription factor [Bernardetiaceae bacterium]
MPKSKILYVEDEPFLAKIVKESLESRDFEVHLLTDGRGVLAAADTFGPDLCLLDVMLPHRDGYALAQDLRRARPHLPIIFLTAKSQTEDVLKGFDSGGNDFLRKPFSLEELIARIHNLLNLAGPKNAAPQAATFIGKYEFAPHRYELKLGTETRKLSHREAELIKIFADHQNRIINRKDILMRVWNDDSFFNSRNLDVYITKLRHYFKDDPSVQIISIKNVGYHFLVESTPN